MKPPLIVAEIGAAHNGVKGRAINAIRAAADAGADAIKLQTYTADAMVADKTYVLPDGPWKGQRLHDLYAKAAMPWAWTKDLFAIAERLGLQAWSTPFSLEALALLESIGCPRYKVASFELTDTTLIAAIAKTGKPLILSTGMASREEISNAIAAAIDVPDITLLKCTSAYPAPIHDMHLATIPEMRDYFDLDVGLSDHTQSALSAVLATALGATMIEKHITPSRADGPDDAFALTPNQFADFVQCVRDAAEAIGEPHYGPTPSEQPQYRLRRPPGGTRA